MWKIFDQSPSRRADFESQTSGNYPLQFCSHRRAENEKVAQRTIVVWSDIMKVAKFWMSLPKQKQPSKEIKSYERLKIAIKNPLIIIKFKLFENIARSLINSCLKSCS